MHGVDSALRISVHNTSFVIILCKLKMRTQTLSSQVVVDILLDAKHLLKKGWCQGAFARDTHGRAVPVMDVTAVSFDTAGAITRGCIIRHVPWHLALDAVSEAIDEPLSVWQDSATLPEILACLDETIATLRARDYV